MKKIVLPAVLVCSAVLLYWLFTGSNTVPQQKKEAIQAYLKKTVVSFLEEDYHRHGMAMTAVVTDLTIDRVTKKETPQDAIYAVEGRVSYRIKGKRTWKDQEGNLVDLGSEQEITHWFTCGLLEDRYLGTLRADDRNRLVFYADKPELP